MQVSRKLVAIVPMVLLTVAVLLGSVGLSRGRAEPSPASSPAVEPASSVESTAKPEQDGDLMVFEGRVVDPEGKPFAGATIYAARWYWDDDGQRKPLDQMTTGADGRFRVAYRKSQMNVPVGRPTPWLDVMITAFAKGYGPGWIDVDEVEPGQEVTLRLVKDDVPINGRVVDSQRRPIAGVAVRAYEIEASEDEDLTKWLDAVRSGQSPELTWKYLGKSLLGYATGLPTEVVTDADGRFHLTGVGPERRVRLILEGPTIAKESLSVLTRLTGPFSQVNVPWSPESGKEMFYGATFEFTASPTQPIVGTVRDADTGQPLPGAAVYSYSLAGTRHIQCGYIKATADQEGRYRLVGMPLGEGNDLLVVPTDGQPYFMTEKEVPELRGGDPVTVDFELKRALIIKGRVTDMKTGEPVVARIHYLPFDSNPYVGKYANFEPFKRHPGGNTHGFGFQDRYETAPDGSYRVVGLPGRGLVGVIAYRDRYRLGQGTEEIEPKDKGGHIKTYRNPVQCSAKWPNAVREVNPPEDAEEVTCDVQLDPGETLELRFVDADDQPVTGVRLDGCRPVHSDMGSPLGSNRAQVLALTPGQPKRVLCRHKERNLGAVVEAKVGPGLPQSLTVKLEPCATVTGRLLDPEGKPISGARLEAFVEPSGDFAESLPLFTTDREGRFRYDGVLPGRDYSIRAESPAIRFATVAKKVSAKPGETIDLGEVRLERR